MSKTYQTFIEAKVRFDHACGFDISRDEINEKLKPHQRDIVQWAVAGGRRAIFASFGLGKTFMGLEIVRITLAHIGEGRALIVIPLGVRREFFNDAAKLGIEVRFIRRDDDIDGDGIYLTNYEAVREGNVTPSLFNVAALDEAAVLRSYGSKTYQEFMPIFADVKFKFVFTAMPSPNRLKELIHYAGFLGIMDTGQALTRFFQRDSTKANNLTLYPHKVKEFWLWVSSWALFIQKPSDLGYDDAGYELPPLKIFYHEVPAIAAAATADRDGQMQMYRDAAVSLQDAAREKRESIGTRVIKMREILAADPASHYILWHDLEAEREAIEAAMPDTLAVYGALDLEERENRVQAFADGQSQYLPTKKELTGSGTNLQRHCHKAIFLGIDYEFHDFLQAVHRIHRFLQAEACEIHIILTESERQILKALQAKWAQHDEMVATMTAIILEYGLNPRAAEQSLTRSMGVQRVEESGAGWVVANNDCVLETQRIANDSIGLIVTSIPFSNHYEYTPSYNDFGHTENNDHFWRQMDFLTPELLRVLMPGRLACVHVKDRILFGSVTGEGVPTVSPFHAEAIFHYRKHGFQYMGLITVVTDVVRENNQTYRLSYGEMQKDGTKMGVGSPEYVVLVRKPQTDRTKGYADVRVSKTEEEYSLARWQVDAHAFWRSSGNRLLTPEEMALLGPKVLAKAFTAYSLTKPYDFDEHVQIGEALQRLNALPKKFMSLAPGSHLDEVWHDVTRMQTLNGEQTRRGLENHICPLQFDIVDRLITRYSNAGDEIFDPFGGLFTVPVRALKLKRRGRAAELNPGYFADGVRYLRATEKELQIPDFFAGLEAA